ncbi:MAG: tripartite tricarboxylate transporter substrate binding protein [Polaromonas sp.]|nr:tripartite tricarboxylate transporter substrate binding protein [Polaromonas sp.]
MFKHLKLVLAGAAQAAVLGAVSLAAPAALAQGAFPDKPIRLLVPFAAGGGQDIFVRNLLPKLGELLGQPVLIDNRAGASGNIAAQAVAQSAPDGYTLLLGTAATHGMNQAIMKSVPFDAQTSFEPVALIAEVPLVLVVHPSIPATDVKSLVTFLKANPGKYAYGSSGTGAPLHLAGELFKKNAGVDILHVPYKGSGPAMVDLVAGRTVMQFDTYAATNGHVKAGTLKRLGVASLKRSQAAPDLPTLREQGFPIEAYSWSGIFAPAKTPRPIVDKLAAAFSTAANDPAIAQRLHDIGFDPVAGSGPDQLKGFVTSELKKWADTVQLANIAKE